VKERPIIMQGESVRAILAGRKTQTRRVVKLPDAPGHLGKWEPGLVGGDGTTSGDGRKAPEMPVLAHTRTGACIGCPYGLAGDRLWVKEAFLLMTPFQVRFRADLLHPDIERPEWKGHYRSPLFMPRWASRLTLEITDTRAERLRDITEADALAEAADFHDQFPEHAFSRREVYSFLWNTINGKREGCDWDSNPWVWVVTFKRVTS
jgi:hypothetical protein